MKLKMIEIDVEANKNINEIFHLKRFKQKKLFKKTKDHQTFFFRQKKNLRNAHH